MPVEVHLVDHPLVADSLRRIRDKETPDALFRLNLERIGTLLIAAATENLPTEDVDVETPLTTAPAKRLARHRSLRPHHAQPASPCPTPPVGAGRGC